MRATKMEAQAQRLDGCVGLAPLEMMTLSDIGAPMRAAQDTVIEHA